jgi:hypothetical protein
MAIGACVLWEFLLRSALSYLLAKAQGARPLSESRCTPTARLSLSSSARLLVLLVRTIIGSA